MSDYLLRRLQHLVPLNVHQQEQLCRYLQAETVPKETLLLEAGEISEHIYFVVEGVLRSFSSIHSQEVTRWFCFPGHFATSYFSFVYQKPSEDSLIALTDSNLLSIRSLDLQYLAHQDPVWVNLNRRLLEEYYTALMQRVLSFQTQSTAERYLSILKQHPNIEDKVPLSQLASYLGMTQATLSRLRSRTIR